MYLFFQLDSYEPASSGQTPAFPFQNNNNKKIFIAGIMQFELEYSAKYIKGSARVHSAAMRLRK